MASKPEVAVSIAPDSDEDSTIYHGYYNAPGSKVKPKRSPATARQKQTARRRKPVAVARDIHKMDYSVEDVPPWYFCILLGFQHYLIMFGATFTNPMVVAPKICIADDDHLTKSELIGTIFFVSGIVTLLQTTLGIRLPIVQGGTFTFVVPITALMSLDKWACPTEPSTEAVGCAADVTPGDVGSTQAVQTTHIPGSFKNLTDPDGDPIWKSRMREIQGAIMVASLFQVVIGFTGLMGLMMRFIGPLVIAPTISLAGLALFDVAIGHASKHWWITLVTVVLIVAFSQYTRDLQVPCFAFEKGKGCHKVKMAVFRMFPVILAMGTTWLICLILTSTGVFPSNAWGQAAKTDVRVDVLNVAPWFRIPLPGQWGMPTVSAASVFGMLAGVLASMVESIGDYYACARMAQVPPPPVHAVNRGIGIEGLGCIIAGAWGTGSGTTSYSENIGAIGITKVASRRVVQTGALIMVMFGIIGKFGALFVTIPDPIVGGVFIVMFGMITAVGISNLQFVDLNSSRNLFIIGFSFFFGLTLPKFLNSPENKGAISTGNDSMNQILTVLLSTSMFMGGLAGFVLDNTIPGTDEERGLIKWRQHLVPSGKSRGPSRRRQEADDISQPSGSIYEIPLLTKVLRRRRWTRYVPFLPTFDETLLIMPWKKRKPSDNIEESAGQQDERQREEESTRV